MNKFFTYFIQKPSAVVVFIFSVLLSGFLLSSLSSAWFWIIDDHEIVNYVSEFEKYPSEPLQTFTRELLATEVGDLHNSILRYRPVYYSFRLMEAYFLGLNPIYYFAVNALFFGGGLLAFGMAARRFFSWPVVLAMMCVVTGLGYNQELWARLGPSEREAFACLMLFIWAFVWQDKTKWAWPLCCVAATLAIGFKENFLFLILPLCIPLYRQIKKKDYFSLLWGILPLVMAIPVVFVVLRAVLVAGHDVYSQNASLGTLSSFVLKFFATKSFIVYLLFFILLLLIFYFFRNKNAIKENIFTLKTCLLYFLIVLLLVGGNFVFYRGEVPFYGRYGFPYYFFVFIGWIILVYPFYIILKSLKKGGAFLIVSISFIVSVVSLCQVYNNSAKIAAHVERTNIFYNNIVKFKKWESICLINGGDMIRSYEPYFSLKKYHNAGLSPKVYYFPLFNEGNSSLEKKLKSSMLNELRNQIDIILSDDIHLVSVDAKLNFYIIEHSSDFRKIKNTVIDHDIRYAKNENGIIEKNTKFFLPFDRVGVTGIKIWGNNLKNSGVVFKINGQDLQNKDIEYTQEYLFLPITDKATAAARNPQLLELNIQPQQIKVDWPAMEISAFELCR